MASFAKCRYRPMILLTHITIRYMKFWLGKPGKQLCEIAAHCIVRVVEYDMHCALHSSCITVYTSPLLLMMTRGDI